MISPEAIRRDKMFEKLARISLEHFAEDEPHVGTPLSPTEIASAIKEIALVIKQRFDKPILPNPGETIAIAYHTPKTAALFFDRVWCPFIADISTEIAIYGATDLEIWLHSLLLILTADKFNSKWKKDEVE